jgi:hypothetical protein
MAVSRSTAQRQNDMHGSRTHAIGATLRNVKSGHFLILPSAFFLSVLANAICLKDYLSFLRSKEAPA